MPRLPNDILPAFDAGGIHDRLTSCKTPRDTAIVLYLLDSGCRSAEFVALTVGHGNMQSGAVTVKQGKGSKDRVVFLGTKARKALWRYMGERPDAKPAEALWLSHRASWAMLTCQCYGLPGTNYAATGAWISWPARSAWPIRPPTSISCACPG